MTYAIEMLNITKDFPGIRANDDVTLRVEKGKIHAILGENGAGKSTIMSILFGLYQPNSGRIIVNGKEVVVSDPNIATDLGIGMVHQHFKLIESFTVTENIILGSEPRTVFHTIEMKKAAKRVKELSELYGLNVDPNAKISDISVGMQQRVEILKMLYRNSEILIFDEPTAVLTPQEIKELMKIMRDMVKEGKTILLITHKLGEIKEVADYCTVLRKGKYIGTVLVKDTTEAEMAEMMVGRQINFKVDKADRQAGEVVLRIDKLNVESTKGLPAVKDFSLQVRKGEIVGLAGIDGNGQTELVYALTGLRKVKSGHVYLSNEEITNMSNEERERRGLVSIDITNMAIKQRLDKGISHVPEDRHKHGLVLDFTMEYNFILHCYDKKPFSINTILQPKVISEYAEKLIDQFDVRSGQGKDSIARTMSGGNQQKAIIAREIDRSADLMIIVQPTRGLDVGAIEYIHGRIVEERDKGKAILLVSLELDEIMSLSDVIAVIYKGELSGLMPGEGADENEIGLMMSGAVKKVEHKA